MNTVFALIDCNNFFVSCERVFRPELNGKPVVVLSSNDGCVVARSNESKLLGIPMGAPAFKFRQVFKDKKITQFSANFELYGNISKRITEILRQVTPRIEVYSVDESFLDLTTLQITDYRAWALKVRQRIWKEVGVPVSIGIAHSKTLAKLGTERAKKDPKLDGVLSFIDMPEEQRNHELNLTPLRDIWGVGWRLAPVLRAEGLTSALSLARMRPQRAQQLMGVHGRQLVTELNDVSCHALEVGGKVAQSIMRSRTFGEDTHEAHVLEAAIASLGARAAHELRSQHLLARRIGFFSNTNRHKPGYRRWVQEIKLDTPTNDSGLIISQLVTELGKVFNQYVPYHRMGVFLYGLVSEEALQTDLLGFVDVKTHDKARARMQAFDHINKRHGRGKIYYAAEDLSQTWQPKHQIRSPHYVSRWDELPTARIMD